MSKQRSSSSSSLTDLLFERADVGLCLVAPDGTVLRANAEWLRSTHFVLDDVLGVDFVALFPETRDMALALHARARAGHHVEVPCHAQRLEGRETWWQGSVDPVPMDGGTGLLITAREVAPPGSPPTDPRREKERLTALVDGDALRENDQLFRGLFENSMDAVYLARADGTILDANAAACLLHGMTVGEIRARGRDGLVVKDERHAAALRDRAATGQVRAELTILRKDGTRVPVETHSVIVATKPAAIAFVISRDITARVQAEAALRQSETRLRALADSIPQLAWTARPDGYITWYNRRWYEYTGTTPAQMEGWGWQSVHDPATLPEVQRRWAESIATGTAFDMEFPLRGSGGAFRRFLTRVYPLKDPQGSVLQWFGTNTDVTELVEAQDALREANRRKDEFLGMLSHELRNPLAPIRNAAYILEHADSAGEDARRARAVLRRQSEHLTRLVDDLLDVTRITRGKFALQRARIDLRDAVARAAEDFRAGLAERGIAFRTVAPAREVWADADPTRINQVLVNLLHNATKFTRRGDEVTMSLHPGDGFVVIGVRDTGAGIDAALLPHVFEPFVQGERTLARTEGGLGLGLALVKAVVELHGGDVQARSEGIGKGSEFTIRLPVATPTAAGRTPGEPATASGGRRVLVVDDNVDAANTLADLMRILGHQAEVAYDGPGALAKLRSGSPEIVFCDLGLPGMSGYEVAQAVRVDGNRSVKLVALSGYAQPEDVRRAKEAGFDAHVAKPPDLEELVRLLAR